jgi:hypothetical protein
MRRLVIRRAESHDAEGIARVCAAGWRDTYHDIKEPERIEAVIAEYYSPSGSGARSLPAKAGTAGSSR